jgi:peptidoglycan/xylan/chitin deacetylase (PgdA/CDA1 family)
MDFIQELKERGFEVGVHGLKHDGKLFSSRTAFEEQAKKINQYIKKWGASGFRSPFTHRNPDWMQALNIDYDSSFFDTDPFEPIAGGTMSIWPFRMGRFIELPYTLAQDHTLMVTLGENSPRLWLEKVDFIRRYHGMALINTHPDYLRNQKHFSIYEKFLQNMSKQKDYWHALPCKVARWWRARVDLNLTKSIIINNHITQDDIEFQIGTIRLSDTNEITIF